MISKKKEIRLILDNVRSVHNVGSIFRTAEAAGVSKIYCVGTTPRPNDRFNQKRNDFAKVALGAEDMIPWEHVEDADQLVSELKADGYYIIGVEQAINSTNYKKVKPGKKTVLILGNEINGVSPELLKKSDVIAEIPHYGKKESLNVSVAAGILIFNLLV